MFYETNNYILSWSIGILQKKTQIIQNYSIKYSFLVTGSNKGIAYIPSTTAFEKILCP